MSASPAPARPADDRAPRRIGVHDSWLTVSAAAVLASLGLVAAAWTSAHLHADAPLRTAALFLHLASLVVGFGAVLAADFHGLLWITGRCDLREAVVVTNRLNTPIWAGLVGLVLSGVLLRPDLDSPFTWAKLTFVVLLTGNGLQAGLLARRLADADRAGPPARRTMAWGLGTALVSQICWWGAVLVGFRASNG
ncbi:hypothetical protein [Yinghuangia seranimata]|uniref:hypothetical protein n=1 Tax=Yinghuangia seranimata TaxID=408067 RepID=UPI00248C705A|nr:hypothetical protein [Yinghuangia seranimata]MDI2129549.1 hypothetical protein [Yinghuangia seranimata]